MPRDIQLYIEDLLESINAIQDFTAGMDFETFKADRKTYSATLREYIVIGEAVGHLIYLLEQQFPNYPWRMIKDFRNLIVHQYFGVDAKIVWDLCQKELPQLKSHIQNLQQPQ